MRGLSPGAELPATDKRTRNSHESIAFRNLVLSLASEDEVALTAGAEAVEARVREFRAAGRRRTQDLRAHV